MGIKTTVKKSGSTNQFITAIWYDYREFSSREERSFDRNVPIIIALCLAIIMTISMKDVSSAITLMKDFNGIALTVVAILAGFNTASLSVIAASNPKVLGKLYGSERQSETGKKSNLLRQTVSLFGYSIIIELIILIIGAILIFVLNGIGNVINIPGSFFCDVNEQFMKITIGIISIPWVAFIFHSLFISVRNITILYNYILYLGRQAKQDNESPGI